MFIFFVNKPITLIPYLIGLVSLFFAGFMNREFPFPFIANSFSFSLWYMVLLVRYYVLSGEGELYIWEVKINRFNRIFDWILGLNALALIIGLIAMPSQAGFPVAFVLIFYTVISFGILQKIVIAKFISEGVKQNTSIKELKPDDLYKELRELIIRKIINE